LGTQDGRARTAVGDETGVALIVCLGAMLLMMALGTALVVATSAESMIAGNFRNAREGRHAAAAALERAISDLSTVSDWNLLLGGALRSGFVDGPPSGVRILPDGSTLDFAQVVNIANCGRVTTCSDSQMDALTDDRPWGANNPRWQPYAYGPLREMLPSGTIDSPSYVVVLVADDQSENDANPLIDGAGSNNPGRGVLTLRSQSFGPKNAHHGVEATVARRETSDTLRVLSWRDLPRLDRP
jgi:hypothetical protein